VSKLLSSNNTSFAYELYDCQVSHNEKIKQLLVLLKDPEIQTFLKTFVEATIATSDLKILQRLSKVEAMLGLLDEELLEEEEVKELSLPAQITELNERVEKIDVTLKPELLDRSLISPSKNITEIRADYLIEFMKNNKDMLPKAVSPFANIDTRIMDSRDFKKFVENYLPEEYQPESMKNLRKLKRDVFEAAEKRCSTNNIFIDKADHGRNELRLIFARQIPDEELPAWMTGLPEQTVTA
jgi:hypothetical protein